MKYIETIQKEISADTQKSAIAALESGQVLFLPQHSFELKESEQHFLSAAIIAPKSKNISYDLKTNLLQGTAKEGQEKENLKEMVHRYALFSRELLKTLLPTYVPHLIQGRTSFRPVEASGRQLSARKDDTRVHVDAFPATPLGKKRILRVFTNVNPNGRPRVWKLGEPFSAVVNKVAPYAQKPIPFSSYFLKMLKITKGYRTLYDHYMLQIHDRMKQDEHYQKHVEQQEIHFPPGSSWIVYSDQVSHAALSGQFLFEQTFYLPLHALQHEELSPLRVLERYFQKKLI